MTVTIVRKGLFTVLLSMVKKYTIQIFKVNIVCHIGERGSYGSLFRDFPGQMEKVLIQQNLQKKQA